MAREEKRQISRYRNGDTLPATQVFYERVDTQAAGSVFIYENCGIKVIKTLENLKSLSHRDQIRAA